MPVKSALGFGCSLLLFLAVLYGAVGYQARRTVFSTDFSSAQIERADPVRIVKSMLIERLDADTGSALMPVIDSTLEDQRGWLTAETRQAAASLQQFLRGNEERIQVHIDMEPVRRVFLANMETTLRASLPPAVARLGETERLAFESAARQAANSVFDRIGSLTFDSDQLAPAGRSQLMSLRSRLAIVQRPLVLVVGVVAVLALLAGLAGQIRQAAGAFLVASALLFLPGLFAASLVGLLPLPSLDRVPGAIANYLPTFMEDLMAPLRSVAIASLVVGIGLMAVSLVLPSRRQRPAPGR